MNYVPYILISMPVLVTFVLYQCYFRLKRHKWRAIHFSVQYSAFFYIIANVVLWKMLWHHYFISYLLIGLISGLAIILIIQWKLKTEVILRNGMKVLMRVAFLLFSFSYLSLLLYKLIIYV